VTGLSASGCLGRSSSTTTPSRQPQGCPPYDLHFLITGLAAAGSGGAGEIANVTQAVYPSQGTDRLPGGGNPLSSNFRPTPVPAAEAFLGGLVGPGSAGDQAVQRHPCRIPAFHGLATDRAFEARDLPHFAMCSVQL
jgi:hypothetical protein